MALEDVLFHQIARDLGITRNDNEEQSHWKMRLVYSALGANAIGSLWDVEEDGTTISIQHFKNRITEQFNFYRNAIPELNSYGFDEDGNSISEMIYQQYLTSGLMYHGQNRVAPSIRKVASATSLSLIRTPRPGEKYRMSGLGCFSDAFKLDNPHSISKVFGIGERSLDDIYLELLKSSNFTSISDFEQMEYLNLNPGKIKEYWTQKMDKDVELSLMRRTDADRKRTYYLYINDKNGFRAAKLATWDCENGGYRKYSNAILKHIGSLPESRYHVEGDTVTLNIGYLYSKEEVELMMLYSWPDFNDVSGVFKREFSKDVFYELKKTLEIKGYIFREI